MTPHSDAGAWTTPYEAATVLVLGARGFIGRWTARLLTRAGARLVLPTRDPARAGAVFERYGIRGEVRGADLAAEGILERIVRETRPNVTFNLAGYGVARDESDPEVAQALNVGLTRRLVDALGAPGIPEWEGRTLVHAGSVAEYGNRPGELREDGPAAPETLYGRTKLEGTRIVESAGTSGALNALTARIFSAYGPGEPDARLAPTLIRAATSESKIPLTRGEQKRDFVYVEDVAGGLLRLGLSSGSPGLTVNLATGRTMSVREFVLTAAGALGIERSRLNFGDLPSRGDEVTYDSANLDSLARTTGWRPPTAVRDGILRMRDFLSGAKNA